MLTSLDQWIKQQKQESHDRAMDGTRYDYTNSAWLHDGKYVRCAHPDKMQCNCYGRLNEGKPYAKGASIH